MLKTIKRWLKIILCERSTIHWEKVFMEYHGDTYSEYKCKCLLCGTVTEYRKEK